MLLKSFEDLAMVYRDGKNLLAEDNYGRIPCRKGTPTVHNIDRIVIKGALGVEIDNRRGGPIGPGATREPGESEIEIRVDDVRRVTLIGSRRGTRLIARGRPGARFRVDMNQPRGERFEPDFSSGAPDSVSIMGAGGSDFVDASRLQVNEPEAAGLVMNGGVGDDRLLGTIGADSIVDGRGDDLIRSGDNQDTVDLGTGADVVFLGAGPDHVIRYQRLGYDSHDTAGDRIFGRGRQRLSSRSARATGNPYCPAGRGATRLAKKRPLRRRPRRLPPLGRVDRTAPAATFPPRRG